MKTRTASGLTAMRTPVQLVACASLLLCLAACAQERPQSSTTSGLDTGITSSFGGGDQTVSHTPDVGITTRVGR